MIKRIVATAGTVAMAAGLTAGLAGTASAVTPTPDGHVVAHVFDVPVQGGGGVWAHASYTEFESLYLTGTTVVTAHAVAVYSNATPPVLITAAVPGVTTYTYKLVILENGRFSAIPWSLAPNQFFGPAKIRGAASGGLSGYATYTFSDTVTGPADGSASPVDPALIAIPATLPAPVSDSTTYVSSADHRSYTPGYFRVITPGYWKHIPAVKAHKGHKAHRAYSKWISPVRVYAPGVWVNHLITQRWTDSSFNNAGQSPFAGNITGFFGLYR